MEACSPNRERIDSGIRLSGRWNGEVIPEYDREQVCLLANTIAGNLGCFFPGEL
ncbi:MAG: hypothetical protein KGN84_17665 [Acidobacteriota bacterium]|nr:hypothetical protein [Acidobacteriota bacterium]